MDKDVKTGIVFTIMGIITLIVSIIWLRQIIQRRRKATARTNATVTHEHGQDGYSPHYTFYVNQHQYDVFSQIWSESPLCKDGEQVTLYFIPDNPYVFYVPREKRRLYLVWALMCFAGVVFTAVGIAMLFGFIKGI